jgi:hypothetical protein
LKSQAKLWIVTAPDTALSQREFQELRGQLQQPLYNPMRFVKLAQTPCVGLAYWLFAIAAIIVRF